jgi:galactokinase
MCQDSLPFWSEVLRRQVSSLREVTVDEFEQHRAILDQRDSIMRMRVEHVVYENDRVLQAERALKANDIDAFAMLLTESGKSALELYELDEGTPHLTYLVEQGRDLPGVLGMRNMGGGFSAIALALVKKEEMAVFQNQLRLAYQRGFQRDLACIEFKITQGAEILAL